MSVRTTSAAVELVLGADYGALPDGTNQDLDPYIETAASIVDDLDELATSRGYDLTDAKLELIERWLSAHAYTKSDPTYQSRSTGGRSGTFVRNPKCPEPYKDMALMLDPTGLLNALLNQARAGATWMGLPPSDQTDYEDRD